jgi:pantoate--beta-alanine ligase
MSSRNVYLNPAERQAATVLYWALMAAREEFASGEREAGELRRIVAEAVNREPLAALQYVSCADPVTLRELEGPVSRALLSMAVFFGKTRLIDNLLLEAE